MKSSLPIALCSLLFCFTSQAQYIEKKWSDKADSIYGYYTVIKPSSGRIQGALLLIDGYGGSAENFFAETKIPNVAASNDLLSIGIPNGGRFYLDASMVLLLNNILKKVIGSYGLRKDQFAIGGMSSVGTIALRYAQLCNQQPDNYPIQPKAVFNVDGSVDLVGLYKSSERDVKKNNGGWWLGEAQMIIDRLKKRLATRTRKLINIAMYLPCCGRQKIAQMSCR